MFNNDGRHIEELACSEIGAKDVLSTATDGQLAVTASGSTERRHDVFLAPEGCPLGIETFSRDVGSFAVCLSCRYAIPREHAIS